MKFSEYTLVARPEQSLDPLGFTQPFSALRSRLYPQFTVLSNAPAYHGVFALVYELLAARQLTPGSEGFSRRFREAECLWGLACVSAGNSVLNVTKYEATLAGRDELCLKDLGRGNALYRSLAYGTLGHYSNPSMAWGFLERGGKHLTPLGTALAKTFAVRGKHSLRDAITHWLDGATLTRDELVALGKAYGLDSPPASSERKAWEEAVTDWSLRAGPCAALWKMPPDQQELDALRDDAAHYHKFFTTLTAHYPGLTDVLRQAHRFEVMSSLCQFIFTREYLLCHDDGLVPAPGDLELNVVERLSALALEVQSETSRQASQDWMSTLATTTDYASAAELIVQHHIRHQQSKGAQPYLDKDRRLLVRERFDRKTFTALHEELVTIANPTAQIDRLAFAHRRDWHFDRALRYVRYIRGTP